MSLSKTMSQVCNGPLYLSDFLQKGNIDDTYRNSRVHLPGLELESYSGYITVDNIDNRNLFFWFFPSTKVPPHQAPLVVYLNGGPGNSSLIGLFEEVGPLKVDEYGQVSKREITWTDQFSMIFIDSPVGVGFSYCDPGKDVKTNSVVADDLCNFLIQFLQLFPEYQIVMSILAEFRTLENMYQHSQTRFTI
uniref:Carboxypeptidase n=1 Tax=Arion vulgaris TaxID=1028688 RepID=A0A0B7A595_9EUPU